MMTVKYETGCGKIALNKEAFVPEFFILSRQIAGEALEKFITYPRERLFCCTAAFESFNKLVCNL